MIPSGSNRLCHIHRPSEKLLQKVKAQKDELTILNKRLSEANRKLQIIDEADRIKYQLISIASECSFRQAIDNPYNKEYIENIFNSPQSQCINIYNELINKRNMIVHRYTSREWIDPLKKIKHGKSVKHLVSSIKAHTLLRQAQ
jgi:hypothetical protein